MIPPRIEKIKTFDNFFIEITYKNGEKKMYDFKKNLNFNFYRNLNNIEYFKLAKSVETTIQWPQGEDIDPNDLYENSVSVN